MCKSAQCNDDASTSMKGEASQTCLHIKAQKWISNSNYKNGLHGSHDEAGIAGLMQGYGSYQCNFSGVQ